MKLGKVGRINVETCDIIEINEKEEVEKKKCGRR